MIYLWTPEELLQKYTADAIILSHKVFYFLTSVTTSTTATQICLGKDRLLALEKQYISIFPLVLHPLCYMMDTHDEMSMQ